MRYFYCTNARTKLSTVVIVDERSELVTFCPFEGRHDYSYAKNDWLCYYKNLAHNNERKLMFEICENQYKKFDERGIVPENWDF